MGKGNTDGPMETDTWVTSKTICRMESEFSITAKLGTDTSGSTRRASDMVSGYTCGQAPMETPTSENTKRTIVRGLASSSSQGSRSGTLANGTKGCSTASASTSSQMEACMQAVFTWIRNMGRG